MNLIMTMRSTCELETYIVAVERIKEYAEAETEVHPPYFSSPTLVIPEKVAICSFSVAYQAAYLIPNNRPDSNWPSKGEVTFKHYSTRYRPDLDLVLKDVTLKIKSNEMVRAQDI